MSWSDLESAKELTHEQKLLAEQQLATAKAYKRLFSTDDGKKVLEDLSARFIYNNDTSLDAVNPNYEAAYHNGERGVIKAIHTKIATVGEI